MKKNLLLLLVTLFLFSCKDEPLIHSDTEEIMGLESKNQEELNEEERRRVTEDSFKTSFDFDDSDDPNSEFYDPIGDHTTLINNYLESLNQNPAMKWEVLEIGLVEKYSDGAIKYLTLTRKPAYNYSKREGGLIYKEKFVFIVKDNRLIRKEQVDMNTTINSLKYK